MKKLDEIYMECSFYGQRKLRLELRDHGFKVGCNRVIKEVDEVWCADITYIPMEKGHAYLVAIMDWHSRSVLSWEDG